ncbi:MAG: hypothetical protein ACKOTZ_05325, partial [Chloroflexota bacterium]
SSASGFAAGAGSQSSVRAAAAMGSAAGTIVDYREIAGAGHAESITGGDRLAAAVAWMADRFAGTGTEGTCPGR